MSVPPIPPLYAEIVTRLRNKATIFARRVGGTGSFAAFSETMRDAADVEVPQAWVLPLQETADPPSAMGEPQYVTERFGVIVCLSNTGNREDGLGMVASDGLRVARQQLFNALMPRRSQWANPVDSQWISTRHYDGCRYIGARHLLMTRARLWHQFEFSVRYYVNYDEDEVDVCYVVREAYMRLYPEGTQRPPHFEGFDLVYAGLNPLLREGAATTDTETNP